MTSLRFALGIALLSILSCSDDKPAPAATDAAVADAVIDAPADSAEAGCPRDAATSVSCRGEDRPIGTATFESTWSGCADGKTYVMTCSVEGSDGQRDCVCKVDGTTIASFRAVTPDVNSAGGGSGWSEFWGCYCGVQP